MATKDAQIADLQSAQQDDGMATVAPTLVAPKAPAGQEDPDKRGFLRLWMESDSMGNSLARWAATSQIQEDPTFSVEHSVSKEEWNRITDGLTDDAKGELAYQASSLHKLYFLADEAKRQMQNEEELAAYGNWGIAGRMGMGIVDPGMLLLAASTGGTGYATKVAQLGDAVKIVDSAATARSALAAVDAAKAGTATRYLTSLAGSGVENAVVQSALQQGDVNKDGTDVAIAAFTGMALHGAISGIHTRSEVGKLTQLSAQASNQLKLHQLSDALADQRNSIVAALAGGEAGARMASGVVDGRTADFLTNHNGDLSSYSQFRRTLESNGKADAKSSTSSATGADQFIAGTWKSVVAQAKPEWAKGLSDDELLKLRTDPEKSAEMATFLDKQNSAALEKGGVPVNVFNLYAAHHFGPERAIKFAKAEADVLMEDIFPQSIIDANPYLKGKTKGEVVTNWTERARKGGVDIDAMIARTGLGEAEQYRANALADFDADSADARMREYLVDDERLGNLDFEARTALKNGEVRSLERALDRDSASLRDNHGTPLGKAKADIDALQAKVQALAEGRAEHLDRLHAEDRLKLGEDLASSKQYAKLREGVVDRHIAEQTAPLKQQLENLQGKYSALKISTEKTMADREAILKMHRGAVVAKTEAKRIRAQQDDRDKLKEALGLHARREGLREEHRQIAPVREKLDRLDQFDNAKLNTDEVIAGKAALGKDTLSAARVVGYSDEMFPTASGSGETVPQMKMAKAVNLANRGTFAGVLRGSDVQAVRDNFGRLVGNDFGHADGSVVEAGASELAAMMTKKYVAHFNTAIKATYGDWLKEQGIPSWRYYNRQVRGAFMEDVGLHIRGQEMDSPAVQAMAGRVRSILASMLKDAKEAGVQGFDSVEVNDKYLPRVFDFQRFHDLERKHGSDQLAKLIGNGMREANPELSDKIADKLGAHYIQRMRELRTGNDPGVLAGMTFGDIGYLRSFLKDAGIEGQELEEVVAKFAQEKTGKPNGTGEGGFRSAKRRAKFDENFSMELRDTYANDGSVSKVTISDLMDSNVETLLGRYVRTMTGHTALAKIGIKSNAEWLDRVKAVTNALEGHKDAKHILEKGQAAYDIVSGRPLEKAGFWQEMMRTTRDLTYATQMENAGLANVPDLASLLAWGNLRYTFRNIMHLPSMFARDADGRLKDATMREQEEWLGIGTDYLNNTVFSSYDVAAEAEIPNRALRGAAKAGSAVAHGARVTGRAVTVGSGMAGLNAFAQRAAAQNILHRLKDDFFGKGVFNPVRMAALGIDGEMGARIGKEMKAHTEWADGELGGKIRKVNWADWTDLEARDRLLYAVNKEARKNIQEEDLGDTFLWQHAGLGKFLTQFRRFSITAYSKQFLRSLNERDAETLTRNALQVTLAGAAYWTKQELQVQGMQAAGVDQEKIEKFKKDTMTGSQISRAALRNAGFMFLLPDAIDSTIGRATGNPMFDFRNSGNSSDLVGGVPGVALINNVGNAAAGVSQAILRGDRQYKQKDLKALQALIPFGNHLMVAPLFQSIAQDLPTTDEDDDPDSTQWGW